MTTRKTVTKKTTAKKPKTTPVPAELMSKIMDALNTILDPELGIGIVDLGLIYNVKIEKKVAHIDMTLTTMGCPVGPMLIEQAEVVLTSLFPEEIEKTTVEIVWDPPWSPDKMKPEVRELMQGF